jgi:hypothetical protein
LGNFNYGAVGAALGIPDAILQSGAGGAQLTSANGGYFKLWAALDFLEGLLPGKTFGSNDDPKDEQWLNQGIKAFENSELANLLERKTWDPADSDPVLRLFRDISDTVNSLWQQARNWIARRDPLVLDLDGDGIETVGISSTTHILFDHNNDGIKTGTGWVKGDDGLLVLDRNGNGVIDNGSELFGDSTMVNGVNATDGFSALRAEDTNKNSMFDAGDTNFTTVAVWQDKNQDGISQTNELHTLSELGIKSINLTSTATSGWLEGATQTAAGTYTKTNGMVHSNNQNFKNTRRVA